MTNLRERTCVEALAWLHTPYHHHARILGVGVDCVHHMCAVVEAVGLAPPIDPGWYERTWHLHRSAEIYAQELDRWADRTTDPKPGDIVLFRFGRTHSHAGILLPGDEVVHAYNREVNFGAVVVTRLDQAPLAGRDPWFWDIESMRATPAPLEA